MYAKTMVANLVLQFHGTAATSANQAGVKHISVSISHSDSQAVAVAVSTF